MERLAVDILIDYQSGKQHHARHFHCGEKGFFSPFGIGIYSPGKEETGYHEDSEPGVRKPAFDAAAVEREQPHCNECHRAPGYVCDNLHGAVSLLVAALYGKGHGHAHAEQEGGEYGVGES